VQVLHGEGVAIHTGPESCAGCREATREALTGKRIGQPLSGEIPIIRSADALVPAEGNMVGHAIASARPAPRVHAHLQDHAGWPTIPAQAQDEAQTETGNTPEDPG
jgi:hypothetical protein